MITIFCIDRDCVHWLPRHVACVASCSDLRLDNNQLSGPIPSTLGSLSLLASLDLSWNNLNGTVPTALSLLSSITYVSDSDESRAPNLVNASSKHDGVRISCRRLVLASNQLTGSLPTVVDFLTVDPLVVLDLSDNLFTGSIPASLTAFTSLAYVVLPRCCAFLLRSPGSACY